MKTTIKSIYSLAAGVVLAASLASCGDEWLDVAPSNGSEAATAIKTSTDLDAARTGMYNALKGTSSLVDYYCRQMFVYGDVHAGDDYQYNHVSGSGRAQFFYKMNYTSASEFGVSTTPWRTPYILIGRANQIISIVDAGNLTDKDDENAKAIIDQCYAEAKALRALAHFDLVRVYGKPYTADNGASPGVPVVTTVLDATAKPARSTVAEVYEQVIADLTEAIQSGALPDAVTPGYLNVWGAKALLSRIYLTKGDYAKALSTAEDIIANSNTSLWTRDEYVDAWSAESPNENEFLFRLNCTNNQDNTDLEGIACVQSVSNYGDMVATKSFIDRLASDPNDIRNDIFVASDKDDDVQVFGTNKVYLNKLRGLGGNIRIAPVIPIIRLSEVYLTAAECALRTGDKAKAVTYLNTFVQNRTTTESALVTEESVTLDRILMERRKELIGEGQRYFDALRNNETITRYTSESDKGWHDDLAKEERSFNRDYYKAISAIPQSEINANPDIEQNPNYAE